MSVELDFALSPHVRAAETACRCGRCGLWRVSAEVLSLFETLRAAVNQARRRAGRRQAGLTITSGVRCGAHQQRVNPGSRHRMHVPGSDGLGHALDVAAPRDLPVARFFALAEAVAAEFPQAGLGFYPRRAFVHLDDGAGLPAGRRWTA